MAENVFTPSLSDVARAAGVSLATASRVVNGRPGVRAELRERVSAAAAALAYRPDAAARSMRTGSAGAVGFVVSDIANPLFAAIARAADEALSPAGLPLVLASSGNDPEREIELLAELRARRVDAVVLAASDETAPGLPAALDRFRAAVLLDREVAGCRADAVLCDHRSGIAAAVRHLAGLGHRRVGLVAGSERQRGSRERIVAFRGAIRRAGLAARDCPVRSGELSRETGYLAAREILAGEHPVTAILAGNNQLFAGVLAAVRDVGLRVPRDVSLVACDDTDLTALHDPPFDVVARDTAALGRAAAELVLERLGGAVGPPSSVLQPVVFEPRASSAAPRSVRERGARAS